MLWDDFPASAVKRIRSSIPAEGGARHVMNVLGALQIKNQALRLHCGARAEPSLTRVLRVDEQARRLYLARGAESTHGAASLFGPLGRIWIQMPCVILGEGQLGEVACHRAEIPSDVLCLQVRRGARVRLAPESGARIELCWPGEAHPRSGRLTDLSEEGLGLELETGCAPLGAVRPVVENARLQLPAFGALALELELIHWRQSGERVRAGARFRVPAARIRPEFRRWLRRLGGSAPDRWNYSRGSLSRSMR